MSEDRAPGVVRDVLLVERYLGIVTPERVARLAADTRAAVESIAATGVRIAYLGSLAIPREETGFCVFMAESQAAVERVNDALAAPGVQVVSGLWSRNRSAP